MFDYIRAQRTVDRQIRRFGSKYALSARLVRNMVERKCTAARLEYSPKERGLYAEGSSRILISPLGLEQPPPDEQLDMILFAGEYYRILIPVVGFRQGTDQVIFYDCNVARTDAPEE